MRRLGVLATSLLLLVPTGRADAATPPPLAGRTTLSASNISHVRVSLARDATIDLGQSSMSQGRGVRLDGDGRLIGVALVRHTRPSDLASPTDVELWATRSGLCNTPGCRPVAGGAFFAMSLLKGQFQPDRATLPKGVYDLYLIADGHQVTVSLTFRGLSGTTRLVPSRQQGATLWSPRHDVNTLPDGSTVGRFQSGAQLRPLGPAAIHQQMWEYGAEFQAHLESCWAVHSEESGDPLPPSGCPGVTPDPGKPSEHMDSNGTWGPCIGTCLVTKQRDHSALGFLSWSDQQERSPLYLGADGTYRYVDGAAQTVTLVLPW